MPFPGSMVPAPVMAAKQGMKDISFARITDTGSPPMSYVTGALTGKGSGLLTPATVKDAAPTLGNLSQSSQAAGKAMSLGSSSFSPVGGGGATAPAAGMSGAAFAGLLGGGGMAGQSMAAAQAMMGQSPGAFGSAAAMAGSGLGSPALSQAAGAASGAAAAAAGAGGAGIAAAPGITPGMTQAPPQFTPLPQIPSMPSLSGVLARLGGMAAAAVGAGPATEQLQGASGSGAEAPPPSQFAGEAPADPTEAEYD